MVLVLLFYSPEVSMTAREHLNETLIWGGEPISRGEMLKEMDRLGFGPAAQMSHMRSAEQAAKEQRELEERFRAEVKRINENYIGLTTPRLKRMAQRYNEARRVARCHEDIDRCIALRDKLVAAVAQ